MTPEGILKKYLSERDVNQILLVFCYGGSEAAIDFYVKEEYQWVNYASCVGHIGKNGTGKKREGDKKTPLGELKVRRAFGIKPNPGTVIDYLEIKESTYACDEEGEYYNEFVDSEELGRIPSGEHMIDHDPAYRYGLETTYNNENIYPLGSAIFVHCEGSHPWTSGCVAMDEAMMKEVLVKSDKGLVIYVFK